MQLINIVALAAVVLAFIVIADNTIQFVNQDSLIAKNIVFTANVGLESIPDLVVGPAETQLQVIPDGCIGNFYSYNDGTSNIPGILGEIAFDTWGGITFYDISSIVNPSDTEGVKVLYPVPNASSLGVSDLVSTLTTATGVSGCNIIGGTCTDQYNAPDDVATQGTSESSFVCLVGNPPTSIRLSARFAQDYGLGKKA